MVPIRGKQTPSADCAEEDCRGAEGEMAKGEGGADHGPREVDLYGFLGLIFTSLAVLFACPMSLFISGKVFLVAADGNAAAQRHYEDTIHEKRSKQILFCFWNDPF
jgi:hypothetical protein